MDIILIPIIVWLWETRRSLGVKVDKFFVYAVYEASPSSDKNRLAFVKGDPELEEFVNSVYRKVESEDFYK